MIMNSKYKNLALLALRLGLAVAFFRNGWEAWEHTQEMVERVTMSGWSPLAPATLLTLIGVWDTAIALFLVLGLWTKKIAIPVTLWIFVVLAVLAKVNGAGDVFDELPYLATTFSLIFLGGGEWGITNLFRPKMA